jgi:hypothetical protein
MKASRRRRVWRSGTPGLRPLPRRALVKKQPDALAAYTLSPSGHAGSRAQTASSPAFALQHKNRSGTPQQKTLRHLRHPWRRKMVQVAQHICGTPPPPLGGVWRKLLAAEK